MFLYIVLININPENIGKKRDTAQLIKDFSTTPQFVFFCAKNVYLVALQNLLQTHLLPAILKAFRIVYHAKYFTKLFLLVALHISCLFCRQLQSLFFRKRLYFLSLNCYISFLCTRWLVVKSDS